jgi:hypothetical protein
MATAASPVGYVAGVEAVVPETHRIFVRLQICVTSTTLMRKGIAEVSTKFACGPKATLTQINGAGKQFDRVSQFSGEIYTLAAFIFTHPLLNI